jgi:hypothetical protein
MPTDPDLEHVPNDEARANAASHGHYYEEDDDVADIRYSLTALGEAVLTDADAKRRRRRFRGFGPCVAVA